MSEAILAAWNETDPQRKCERTWAISDADIDALALGASGIPPGPTPGRPSRPILLDPREVPQRSLQQAQGRAALLHAIAHIEFNAINLALDAALRFPAAPSGYAHDWIAVAKEEATHFSLLHAHLNTYGATYGDFGAHDGLWEMAKRTADDVLGRMALVPRVLEARGLDVTPAIIEKLKQAGDLRAAEILGIILRDEVEHVRIGNRWYRFFCTQRGLCPTTHFAELQQRYRAPKLKPPFNVEARIRAGFTESEISSWSI